MRKGRQIRALILGLVVGAALCLWPELRGAAQTAATGSHIVVVAELKGAIGPAAERHVQRAIDAARTRDATALVLRINTPGGLASSMRGIITRILGSSVPVVGYVAPSGAHAASAGTYIIYATHVAAMAPGTNLGAATPVTLTPGAPSRPPQRGKPDGKADGKKGAPADTGGAVKAPGRPADAMKAKVTNDAVAFIRSLAEMHGRNADWAEKAVRQAASLSARQALKQKVIDLLAADLPALLTAIDGRMVIVSNTKRTLATRGAVVERIERDFMTRVLGVITNPNVALILMMIGIYGLIFEFMNPGSIGPGVIGAIALILGLYALNQLPLDFAGLALLILGIGLMIAEAFTPTLGVLGVGGLVAFVIGAAMLIDTDVPAYRLSWSVIGGVAVVSAAFLSLVLGYAWRAHRRPVRAGADRMVDGEGEVIDWHDGEGHVWAEGERWHARGPRTFAPGERVRIERLDGLTLILGRPTDRPAKQPHEEET